MEQAIADLVDKLYDSKIALIEAKEALDAKDVEIKQLKQGLEERLDLVQGWGGFKYKKDAEGNAVGYPSCPSCEVSGLVTVLKPESRGAKCPRCKETFSQIQVILTAEQKMEQKRANERLARPRQASLYSNGWMG